jgi:hypothetical protein
MEPYEEMRRATQILLDMANPRSGGGAKRLSGGFVPPVVPAAKPASVITPYPQQTAPAATSVFTPYGVETPQANTVTSYGSSAVQTPKASYGSASNVRSKHLSGTQKISKAFDDVGSWFKRKFARKGEFAVYEDKSDRTDPAYAPPYVSAYDPYAPTLPRAPPIPEVDRSNLTGTSIAESGYESSGHSRHDSGRGLKQAKKPMVHLSPAKRLLKVTGGRALATAAELTTFKDSFTLESIDELALGLEDPDWKVRTRAILGLEIVAEQYGLPAVARVKNQILSLNGAPQSSLRTAANRFYAAIKDVVPVDDVSGVSAFNFLDAHGIDEVELEGKQILEENVGDEVVEIPVLEKEDAPVYQKVTEENVEEEKVEEEKIKEKAEEEKVEEEKIEEKVGEQQDEKPSEEGGEKEEETTEVDHCDDE